MGYIVTDSVVHTDPPLHTVEGGIKVDSVPEGVERCEICFGEWESKKHPAL
jgi:hypothetical protein